MSRIRGRIEIHLRQQFKPGRRIADLLSPPLCALGKTQPESVVGIDERLERGLQREDVRLVLPFQNDGLVVMARVQQRPVDKPLLYWSQPQWTADVDRAVSHGTRPNYQG